MISARSLFAVVVTVGLLGCASGDNNNTDASADAIAAEGGPAVDTVAPDPDTSVDTGLVLPDGPPPPDTGRDGPVVVTPTDAKADTVADATVDGTTPDATVDGGLVADSTIDGPPASDTTVDGPAADGSCGSNAECDDGLTCTIDICGIDGCTNVVTGNFCVIDAACVAGGALNALNQCEICQPQLATDAWSNADESGCDDGDLCTHTDQCVAGKCAGTAYSCDDNLTCTADECTGTGPAPDGCTYTLQPGFCAIDGVCVVGGDADSTATCRICAPTAASDDWTLQPGFCLIDETCHLESGANPLNACEVCKTATAADSWTVLPGTDPSPHKIVITEIMANPSAVTDTAGEWFEIHNAGSVAVDLDGWTLRDDGQDTHRISGTLVVAAGAYAVLGRNDDSGTNGGVTVDYQYTGVPLANTADEIVLIDEACREVDRVAYDTAAGWTVPNGASLQLQDPASDNNNPANWCVAGAAWSGSAGDDGTPGAATSCPPPPDAGVDSGLDATVDATVDAGADAGVDGGYIVTCANTGVLVEEIAVGNTDYVALKNYGTDPVDIVGYRLEMYGISSTPTVYTIEASDVSGPLGAGDTVYVFEYNSGSLAGDINTGANIPFYNGPPTAANPNAGLLFDATGNLLDYASVGDNIGKPDNVTFTAVPWPASFDSSVSSFQRIATNGSCPAFNYLDWYYGNLTR